MMKNEDLELLNNLALMLRELDLDKNSRNDISYVLNYIATEIDKIIVKLVNNRDKQTKRSSEYNKKNKKYHNLISAISYNKKQNNYAKVRELEEKLKNFKKSSTI